MARVDFYVLDAAGETSRWQFACKLAEKAYRLNNTVHIQAADRGTADKLDKLLWTWREGSFVPHDLTGSGYTERPPVTIGYTSEHANEGGDLLINLGDDLPGDIGAFPRVAEIVTSDDDKRQQSRVRYAQYREQGHTLDTHKL